MTDRVGTATLTNVASSAATVSLFAGSGNARGRSVFNDSSAILYLKFGTTAASTTSYTVQLAAGAYYEFPSDPLYCGPVQGIWASANGSARLTETSP